MKIAIDFKPDDDSDCILMYCSQNEEGLGDFMALVVKDQHVEFRFDVGTGLTQIKSNYIIQPGTWTHVLINKDFKTGSLSVNSENLIEGKILGPARMMTLNTPLYIGGVDRTKIIVNKDAGTARNFRGCINEV